MQQKIEFTEDLKVVKYHEENPHIYAKFEEVTLQTIERGFKHYSAKGVIEIIRWWTAVKGNTEYKISNEYSPFYARLFEQKHPQHKGFFRMKRSKFD